MQIDTFGKDSSKSTEVDRAKTMTRSLSGLVLIEVVLHRLPWRSVTPYPRGPQQGLESVAWMGHDV